jgi:hypothetical protein
MAKIAPWWLARRDNFSAKVPGLLTADGATNVYSLNRRAVINKRSLSHKQNSTNENTLDN